MKKQMKKQLIFRYLSLVCLLLVAVGMVACAVPRPAESTSRPVANIPWAMDSAPRSTASSSSQALRPDSSMSTGILSAASGVSQPESVEASSAMADNAESKSLNSQSQTAEELPSWADKACTPVTFAEDPAGCISYAMWNILKKQLEDIESREMSQDKKEEWIQQRLERAHPTLMLFAGLADLNQDAIPELLVFPMGGAAYYYMQVYDISAEEPEYVVQCMCGDITADRVYNEAGNEVTRIFTAYGSATTPKESAAFFEKKADNNWDVWICVKVGNEDFESFYTEVFHGDEQVNDPDGILYNQLMNRDYPVVQPQVLYVELDDFPVYEETLSTGEDWWIAYGRMLWEQYQQALQQTGAAG